MKKTVSNRKGELFTFTIDDEDEVFFESRKWVVQKRSNNRYLYVNGIAFHRAIMKCPTGMEIDHKNGDSFDNRKQNLRVCSHAENLRNRPVMGNSSTGLKGVYFDKSRNKYFVRITFEGKKYNLGRFESVVKAGQVYDRKARELHGDFARTNFGEII